MRLFAFFKDARKAAMAERAKRCAFEHSTTEIAELSSRCTDPSEQRVLILAATIWGDNVLARQLAEDFGISRDWFCRYVPNPILGPGVKQLLTQWEEQPC